MRRTFNKPNSDGRLAFCILPLLLFTLVCLCQSARAQSTTAKSPVPLPVPFTPVIDNANVIDPQTRQRLESIYENLKKRANIEFAVLTVPTTGDLDIFDFSLAVARGWGIGAKDGEKNGFLLVVAIQDHKYFTQVSDHLEGDLPDGLAGQIQRERLVPAFKRANYSQGIFDTIQAYVATLGEKRGFSIDGIDQSYAYKGEVVEKRTGGNIGGGFCTVIIVIFVLILLFSSSRRRGGGGCLQALFLGSLFSNLGGGRGGGWGGSSSGWGGGGGFGGGGGGFGGGGSFGGGGAGGSW